MARFLATFEEGDNIFAKVSHFDIISYKTNKNFPYERARSPAKNFSTIMPA